MVQKLWDSAKAVLTGKFTMMQVCLKKRKELENLTPKGTRKRRIKSKVRRKEIIKIRVEINETETKKRKEKKNQ